MYQAASKNNGAASSGGNSRRSDPVGSVNVVFCTANTATADSIAKASGTTITGARGPAVIMATNT